MSAFEAELRARFGARVSRGQPLAELTSFRIGGPADFALEVEDEPELGAALGAASRCRIPAFCLGTGTNILVSDRGVRGLVIRLGGGFREVHFDGCRAKAGAAVQFGELVAQAVAQGLAGLEFGEGIPGSVGGALIMNAGAFGGEMAPAVSAVRGADRDGTLRTLAKDEIGFFYRHSVLPPGFIVAAVEFDLIPGDREALIAKVAELKAKRAARQPQGVPNAGSIFKNPAGTFAGRLLEGCGLKGERIGGAAFSEQHANFIVNLGGARAGDVRALMDLARQKVEQQTGVRLEPEVKLVGEW
ncbi:MAG TPA: UDP-N-acetylmuramate dehydrogenase [Candidatus Binataceae bacterium]|jgi:UDP-N-acetylmuramate dehydrogenase|nr:UDP-N-acetylmuramate dehydrogenase [Candidatus Binataceae bacterium]